MIEETCKRSWPRDKIQDGGQYLHDLFSCKSFCVCARNQKINEWIEPLQTLNENFHVIYFVIETLKEMQQIFDRDRRPARLQLND